MEGLSLGTADQGGGATVHCGDRPRQHRMSSSVPGLRTPGASPPPSSDKKKCSQTWPMSPGEQNHTPLETPASQGPVKGVPDRWGPEPMPLRVGLGLSDREGCVLALVLHSELRVPSLQGLALLRTLWAAELCRAGFAWAGRGNCGSPAPRALIPALGSRLRRSEAVSAQVTDMKRNADRAAGLSPSPEQQAPRLRQKHRLLQVREKGPLALQRQDLPQPKSPQPPRLAEELEAPCQPQHVRGLERLYLAHRLGAGGGQAREHRPDSEGPAQQGTARLPRAREKHRAAIREEKSRKEGLAGKQSRLTQSQRKAAGPEKLGAPRAAGLPRRPLCPREQNKSKRPPLMKARGGHRPADPWGSRGVDREEFLAVPGAFGHLQRREKGGARDRRRRAGKGATPPSQGRANSSLDPSPEGNTEDPEQPWPICWTHGGDAAPQASLCRRGDKSRWQRELEFAFQELFNTNRELKKHLTLHLALGPAADQSAKDELRPRDVQEPRGESQRDEPAVGPEADVEPGAEPTGPAQAKAPESRTSLEEFLNNLKNQKYLRPTTFPSKTMSEPLSPKAGVFIGAENRLLGGLSSREALARSDPLAEGPRRRFLQEQADGASLVAWWRRPDGPPEPVPRTGPQGLSWEARSQAGLEGQREQRRAGPASYSSLDPEEEGACACDTTSPWASGFILDDDRHSQMIHDLQQQIEEQNKLHKQFLAEARKRLQEFQRI